MKIVRVYLIFLFLLTILTARPIKPKHASRSHAHKVHPVHVHRHRSIRASNSSHSNGCYFSVVRQNSKETHKRDRYATVSTDCSSDLRSWESLLEEHVDDEAKHDTTNNMDIVAIRGAAEYIDWDNLEMIRNAQSRQICGHHVKELLTEWKSTFRNQHIPHGHKDHKVSMLCSVPDYIPALCNKHKKELKLLASVNNVQQQCPSFSYCLRSSVGNCNLPISSSDSFHSDNVNSDIVHEKTTTNVGKNSTKLFPLSDLQNLKIFELIEVLNIKYAHPRQDFSKLTRRSKMRRVAALNSIIDAHCEALAPGEAFDLRELALKVDDDDWGKWSNQQFDEIMKVVAREYQNGETMMERRSVLAIAAGSLPYSTVLKYIPNLTHYQYRQARLYAFRMNRDKIVISKKRVKFDRRQLEDFVFFFTSSLFRTDLPFGRRTLKREDGTKFDIPDVLRTIRHTEIIQLYIKSKIENGEQNDTLSVSSMYKILEACKATQRKSLTCLDYYVQEADDGFDAVKTVIDYLLKNQYIDGLSAKSLSNRFLETKQYFKGDYKLHLKNVSRVGDHCIKHSLSSDEEMFSESCSSGPDPHEHDMFCQRCEMAKETFQELLETVSQKIVEARGLKLKRTKKENEIEAENLSEKLLDVKEAIAAIESLKRHTVRNVHIQRQRLEIIESMAENEAFLTMDWAQKLMPTKFREPQSEYYGKSGISMHVINVLKIDKNKAPSHHNLIHIMKQDNQDSSAVLSIVEHSLKVLRQAGVVAAHLRSDNAVCYHSTGAIMSLARIAKTTGVTIKSFTYSEPQGGKGAADRAANNAKKKVKDYINSGHDAETPEQIFESLTTGKVPKAMSTYLINVDPLSTKKTSMKTVPFITSYFDFWFDKDVIQMRKYGGIGTGERLTIANYQTISGNLTVLREGGFTTSTGEFWNVVHCQTMCNKDEAKETIEVEIEEESTADEKYEPNPDAIPTVTGTHYFRCPEDHCDRKFTSFAGLQRHILVGKHSYHPEKEGMIDTATSIYKQRLEHWDTSSRTFFPSMEEEILTSSKTIQVVKKGWALPEKRQCQRHSDQAKQFVKEAFEKLQRQRTKPDFKGIADQMKRALSEDGKSKKFAVSERLNYKQIKNMYLVFGKAAGRLISSKQSLKNNGKTELQPSTTENSSKKRKNEGKETHEQKKKKTNGRPKRDEQDDVLNEEEFDIVWIKMMKVFDELECDDSDALYDNLDDNDDIVDEVMKEVMKNNADIYQ